MDLGQVLSQGGKIYFIGIKGTGMCALAELLCLGGAAVSGSDCADVFYTDEILKDLEIPYYETFQRAHVPPDAAVVIHSAAYAPETNPEMAEAQRLGLPLVKYADALGAYSALFDSAGIAGVHGKTTTTAMAGVLFQALALPAQVLAGSAVEAFGGRSTLSLGDTYFAAETCEYRRHFLAFHPQRVVLTSVESDHQDYFPRYEDIRDAFLEYVLKLPPGGELVYCADDRGAGEVVELASRRRGDIAVIPYGFSAPGDYRVVDYEVRDERIHFNLAGRRGAGGPGPFKLRVPGRHCALDAAAALALAGVLIKKERGVNLLDSAGLLKEAIRALEGFTGSRRRSEIIGEAGGVLFMDDYGHHPTAIKATLQGLREFYPQRRLVVSFMSHTYSRTAALLEEFAASLLPADVVFLHKIYASAREHYTGGVNGRTLYEKTAEVFAASGSAGRVFYTEEPEDAAGELRGLLRAGDLFITLGAGDNWRLGKKLLKGRALPGGIPVGGGL
ncbi:MAG: UDP-N-acetylmuramate--L-alanine ligase [Treponema sp.]|jgi:UDP-N-acetylmuramate--alanine ligase|nr:UDP-N-acetylmuramate--L-alanine ligase [Treponema sp.]